MYHKVLEFHSLCESNDNMQILLFICLLGDRKINLSNGPRFTDPDFHSNHKQLVTINKSYKNSYSDKEGEIEWGPRNIASLASKYELLAIFSFSNPRKCTNAQQHYLIKENAY